VGTREGDGEQHEHPEAIEENARLWEQGDVAVPVQHGPVLAKIVSGAG
jgi:hypothetical protein